MIIQPIDGKRECLGYYYDGIIRENISETTLKNELQTWKYSPSLKGAIKVDYAYVHASGASMESICPREYKEEWLELEKKLAAFHSAANQSKISFEEHCFYNLVPNFFVKRYFRVRENVIKTAFRNFSAPKNYEILCKVHELITNIKYRNLNIQLDAAAPADYKKYLFGSHRIVYELFGTKTGRLKTSKGSFPIMNLPKDARRVLKPTNDLFVEFDFNAAELRTFLSLCGIAQPKEDLHAWNANNVYPGITREDAKEKIFAWLYNASSKDLAPQKFYKKELLLDKFWDGEFVDTPFGRRLKSDEFHALNYLLQSTTSDLLLDRAVVIDKMLENSNSHIAFMLHDSLVLDIDRADRHYIRSLLEEFKNTSMGQYVVNLKMGKNYADMINIELDK